MACLMLRRAQGHSRKLIVVCGLHGAGTDSDYDEQGVICENRKRYNVRMKIAIMA